MKTFLLPLLLVLAMLLAWLLLRKRGRSCRLAGSAAALGALTLLLMNEDVSPLLTGSGVPDGPEGHWLRCVGILWWVIAARLTASLMRSALERDALSREARITADLLSGLIYLATFLIILDFVLLLPVGGLVATSGVVAVVIGLALQNTLADVFSGIAVGIERPFGAGDRITLADGVEGTIIEINWRSIRIQTDGEDVATIPNSVVAKAQILNRSVPTKRRSVHVVVTCAAEAEPEVVLELLRRAAMLCPTILAAPSPLASMIRLGVRTNTYAIDYFVADTAAITRSRTSLLAQTHRQMRYAGLLPDTAEALRGAAAADRALVDTLPVFAALTHEHRDALAARIKRRPMRTGEAILERGADPDELILISAGVIDILSGTGEEPTVLRRAGPGEAIGDIGLVAGKARPYSARAATDGLLLVLSRNDLLALIEEDDQLASDLERSASEHVMLLRAHPDEHAGSAIRVPHLLETLRRRLSGMT